MWLPLKWPVTLSDHQGGSRGSKEVEARGVQKISHYPGMARNVRPGRRRSSESRWSRWTVEHCGGAVVEHWSRWTGGVSGVPSVRPSIGATRQDPPLSQNIDSLMWDRSVFPIFLAALAAQWQPRSRYFIERSNSKLPVTNLEKIKIMHVLPFFLYL